MLLHFLTVPLGILALILMVWLIPVLLVPLVLLTSLSCFCFVGMKRPSLKSLFGRRRNIARCWRGSRTMMSPISSPCSEA